MKREYQESLPGQSVDSVEKANEKKKSIRREAAIIVTAGALVTGSMYLASCQRAGDQIPDADRTAACEAAGIELRGDSGVTLEQSRVKDDYVYHIGVSQEKRTQARENADGAINLHNVKKAAVPAGVTVGDIALAHGMSKPQFECVNGVAFDNVYDAPVLVKTISQHHDSSDYVIRKDTPVAEQLASICPDDILNQDDFPVELRPGDVISSQCALYEEGDREINPEQLMNEFAKKHTAAAEKAEKQYGLPKDINIAFAAAESRYGRSEIAKNANNLHHLEVDDTQKQDRAYEANVLMHLSRSQLSMFEDKILSKKPANGGYDVAVKKRYEVFSDPADSMMEFARSVSEKKREIAYEDDLNHPDQDAVLESLFFGSGAIFDADNEYYDQVRQMMEMAGAHGVDVATKRQAVARDTARDEEGLRMAPRSFKSLGPIEKSAFLTSSTRKPEAAYQHTMEVIESVDMTADGYDTFVKEQYKDRHDLTKNKLYKKKRYMSVDKPHVLLHHTGWPEAALGHDANKFMQSMISNSKKVGNVAVHGYIAKDGEASMFVANRRQLSHVRGYSSRSYGFEVAAHSQDDINKEQYESLMYTAARIWKQQHPDRQPYDRGEIREFIWGHGEVTEKKGIKKGHVDMPTVVCDALSDKLYAFLVENELAPVPKLYKADTYEPRT